MIAPAITRRLKLDPEIRTTAGGGVSVTDTMSSVPNTVAHMSTRLAKRSMASFERCKAVIGGVDFDGVMSRKRVSDVSRRARFIEEPCNAPKRTAKLRRANLDGEPIRSLNMAKELFGTDGIRGEPGKPPLDDATLYAAGLGHMRAERYLDADTAKPPMLARTVSDQP